MQAYTKISFASNDVFPVSPGTRLARFQVALSLILSLAFLVIAPVRCASAQPEVGTAPPVLENERVRAWNVTLTPGQPVSMGRKDNDAVVLFVVGGEIRTTHADGKTSMTQRKFGDVVYIRKGDDEKEELVSGGPARVVVVELKNHPVPVLVNKSGYPLAYPRTGSKKAFENDRVVVWNYSWTPGVPTPVHYHDKDSVAVFRYDAPLKSTTPDGKFVVNDRKAGEVIFSAGDRIHSELLVKGRQSVIAMELK